MPKTLLPPEKLTALLTLLDDTSPNVRSAVLKELGRNGTAARDFLLEISNGKNRIMAWHARWFLQELKLADPVAEFRDFIRSLCYELETGTLLLARTANPDLDVGATCEQLDNLAARCRELTAEPASLRDRCRTLNRVLFHEHGFRCCDGPGATPADSLIDSVLARRRGISSAMATVYLLVAHRCGLPLEPVGLPRHFLIGCYTEGAPFFIDPGAHGALRSAGEVFEMLRRDNIAPKLTDLSPTPVREVLHGNCRTLAQLHGLLNQRDAAEQFSSFAHEFEATYLSESE